MKYSETPIRRLNANLSNVTIDSCVIKTKQEIMERIGTHGTNGHLNLRSRSGCCLRSTIIEIARNMNAERVPIFTSSIIRARGKKAAINAATIPTNIILVIGDLKLLWTVENISGNNPSLLIEKNILVCPKRLVRSTDVIPHNEPTDTIAATTLAPT